MTPTNVISTHMSSTTMHTCQQRWTHTLIRALQCFWMCPKAYHYDCMHHDDQLPMQKDRPSCGWHFCSFCDKAAQSMCYTCTFSVCRLCIKQAKFVCVKGNKGLCETCMEFILLIETDEQGNTNLVRKSFDEKNSLENLFKVYWKALQGRISLTSDEITRAKNMLKESRENYQTRRDGAVDKEQTELIFPGKGLPSIVPTNSTNAPEQFRCISGEGSCSTEHDCVNESSLNLENDVDASNGDAVVGSGSFPESAVVDLGDEEEIWHRRDESGQIKGPFSMAQLDYWCTKHHFRANLRIWRATEKEEDSILLMDALNGNFPKELPQLKTCLTDASAFSNNKIISSKSDDAVLVPRSGQITVFPTNGGLDKTSEDSHSSEPNTQVAFLDCQNKSGAHVATDDQAGVEKEPCEISDSISVEIPDLVAELPVCASEGVPLKVGADLVTEIFPSELTNLSGSICISSCGGSECPKENHERFCDLSQTQNPLASSVTTHHTVEKQAQNYLGDNLSSDTSSTIANLDYI